MPGWAAWKLRHPDRYKQSNRKVNARLYTKKRRFIWEYLLQHPCIDCGEKDPIVLEFDHVRGAKSTIALCSNEETAITASRGLNEGEEWKTRKQYVPCSIERSES
jgi:hypothetical protein